MVFVVSEIGVNWNGSFELLEEMIKKSKNAGCDAVKLQAFSEKEIADHPDKEKLLTCSVNSDNVEQVNKIALDSGIEWFCTPMYDEAVDFLDSYVKRYKIRHADGISLLEDKESNLIKKVLDTGKQVIISSEITPMNSKFFSIKEISWLYCVPKYPSSFKEIDFKNSELTISIGVLFGGKVIIRGRTVVVINPVTEIPGSWITGASTGPRSSTCSIVIQIPSIGIGRQRQFINGRGDNVNKRSIRDVERDVEKM